MKGNIYTKIELNVPTIPNFIIGKINNRSESIPIKDLNEEELRALGAAWTENLIEKSKLSK